MRTTEQIQISVEDTQTEIKRVAEFLELTLNSKIDSSIKSEFQKRLSTELEWLYNIKDEEEEALKQRDLDLAVDCYVEEEQFRRHAERQEQNGFL